MYDRSYVYDTETHLYYLQSRYYDPEMGRFISADGLVSTGQGLLGNNMFTYCLNNPVNSVDSSGEVAISTAVVIGSGIAGGLLGLLSYLGSTKNPTTAGALAAVFLGASSAIAGSMAGAADDIAKLAWSVTSGVISAVSSGITTKELGGNFGDILSSMFSSFSSGSLTTYLGAYLDTSMFSGFDEGASTFCMTEFSGFFALPLSSLFDSFEDMVIGALTYAPNRRSSRNQWYTRNASGTSKDTSFAVALSY